MRLLLDNQLPPVLARWLAERGHDVRHVLDAELARSSDREIWETAMKDRRVLVSKDSDFFILATRPNDTGSLIWLRTGNCRTHDLITLIEKVWPQIEDIIASGQRIIEVR